MADEATFYTDHWRSIEEERVRRYERMFAWRPEQSVLLEPASIEVGSRVLDLGCGPGFLTAELARRVGPTGRAVGVDINERFVTTANDRAKGQANLRYVHYDGAVLPFDDASLDRAVAKNVLEYVPDLPGALRELHRVLVPGGRLHTIDSDWGFVIAEPWTRETTERFFAAAAPAFKEPLIGRKLAGALVRAGFSNVEVRISAAPDRRGGALPVMHNMAGYVKAFARIPSTEVDALLAALERAVADGTYLFVLPQFLVTGVKES
jgi:ubiquinone/menaquinone biosynthesis C-methylase UbiE